MAKIYARHTGNGNTYEVISFEWASILMVDTDGKRFMVSRDVFKLNYQTSAEFLVSEPVEFESKYPETLVLAEKLKQQTQTVLDAEMQYAIELANIVGRNYDTLAESDQEKFMGVAIDQIAKFDAKTIAEMAAKFNAENKGN